MTIARPLFHRISAALCVVALVIATSCGGGGTEPPRSPTQVVVTPSSLSLVVGESRTVTAEPRDAAGVVPGQTVAWSSSDPAVATVAGGNISALAVGTATITASTGAIQGTVALTVKPVPVASVRITPATADIFMGEQQFFDVETLDSNGGVLTARVVAWTSSDPTIATVFALSPAKGAVTGNKAGPVTITATSEGKSGTLAVTVLFAPRLRLGVSGMPAPFESAPVRLKSDDAGFLADLDIPAGPPVDFNRLAPGTYTLTAKPLTATVNGTAFTYLPRESEVVRTFPITTTSTATVALAWMLRSGALAVTTSGLPAGGFVACNYQFDLPGLGGTTTGGFTVPSAQTTTVAVYGSGQATLSCQSLTIAGVTYAPTVPTQSVSVPASTTPLPVTIIYAPN